MPITHAMSHADAAWLHMDQPTNPMIITSALWFDRPLDEEALRDVVRRRLVEPYARFRQRVRETTTGAHWEDDPAFDLDLHMRHLALPAPGDRAVLARVTGDLIAEPLDRSRPLWGVYLLDGYGEGSAIVCRMHHAIADGIALARVMLELTDAADGAEAPPRIPPAPAREGRVSLPLEGTIREVLGLTRGVVRGTLRSVRQPSRVAELARERAADLRAVAKLLLAPSERTHPLHDTLGVKQRVAWSRPLQLEAVRAAGRAYGATINDVLIAAVAGAMRRHLEGSGDATEDVRATVPFNLRPPDEPLPSDLGNRFGLVLLDLPVATPDPVARVRESAARMQAIKASREGAVTYGILGAMGHTPPVVESRLVDLLSSKATMVLTNVPGPRQRLALAGVPLEGILVWAPCSGAIGMSVSIFSYAGSVTVGFMVNGNLVDDPSTLVDKFEASLEEVLAVAAS
jgi:diacylglycerol O-acyltransferase